MRDMEVTDRKDVGRREKKRTMDKEVTDRKDAGRMKK